MSFDVESVEKLLKSKRNRLKWWIKNKTIYKLFPKRRFKNSGWKVYQQKKV